MRCLLDVLAAAGVPKAHTAQRWPVEVVTQILRDRVGVSLPIKDGLTGHEARHMRLRLEAAGTGGWSYEVSTHRSERGTYTVIAVATRARPAKLATRKRASFDKMPVGEDEMDFPEPPEVQDTRGINDG